MAVKRKKSARSKTTQRGAIVERANVLKEKPIGEVTHFYNVIKVAIVKFKKPVKVGAQLKFKGATTDFEETVTSMQFDHKPITVAPKGKQIGIKVSKRVREGDSVYSAAS